MTRKAAGVVPFTVAAALLVAGIASPVRSRQAESIGAALTGTPAPNPQVANFGCRPETMASLHKELVAGELIRVDMIACLPFKSSHFGVSDPILSPDGEKMAQWHAGIPAPLEVAGIRSGSYAQMPNHVSFRGFRALTANTAIAWSDDSESVWTVRQDTVVPSGFAKSGLVPIKVGLDGKPAELPPLAHPAGPLDAVQWVGGKGVAIAQFGTRGGYYKPEHADAAPTFAIVDAARGRVRASLAAKSIPDLATEVPANQYRIMDADTTAVTLKDGRVRAVLQFSSAKDVLPLRLIWTEGAEPEIWKGDKSQDRGSQYLLTPDGTGLLIYRGLQPDGVQVSDCGRGGRPVEACNPPPTPVDGPIVELVDIATRRTLWQVSARASAFWSQRARPAISPDGRLALVELPPEASLRRFGLIDMRTGKLVDRFSAWSQGSYPVTFDFMPEGHRIWLACGNMLVGFDLGLRARVKGRKAHIGPGR